MTGNFTLDYLGERLVGNWQKPDARRAPLPVVLFKADPKQKKYARIDPDQLKADDGKTFGDVLDEHSGKDYGTKHRTTFLTTYCRKNILSTRFDWEYLEAPHPVIGHEYHSFDLVKKKEIVLWDEIAPAQAKAFTRLLAATVDPILAKHRREFPDKEWAEVFSTWGDEEAQSEPVTAKTLGRFFKLVDGEKLKDFYLSDDGVHVLSDAYYNFPYAGASSDVAVEVTVPFSALQGYLKKSSVLRTLPTN